MKISHLITSSALVATFALAPFTMASAQVSPFVPYTPSTSGIVSITLDDANESHFTYAAPILAEAGLNATLYVPTGFIGEPYFATWPQIQAMARQGIEMAAHTVWHTELPLPESDVPYEIQQCRADLESKGFAGALNFASPFGAYDQNSLAQIAAAYNSHRGFHEVGANAWPYNKYYLHNSPITNQTTLAEVEGWIDDAIANDHWVILTFHEILPTVDPDDPFTWSTEQFAALMSLLKTKNIAVKTVAQALAMNENIMPDSSFEQGLNWSHRPTNNVTLDAGTHGSYPTPTHAVKMTAHPTDNVYLFSPQVAVSSAQTYGIRAFVNNDNLTSGELGFYIDEYDASGNWISGQWKGMTTLDFVIDESYTYTPSSANVATMSVQVYLTAGSTGYAYLDNIEVFTK